MSSETKKHFDNEVLYKAECFDELAKHYYDHNFGQTSKSDIDLLMFKFYLEKLVHDNKNPNGTIDYNKISDYKISKELGITQQRIRNLKIKKELVYPTKFSWKDAFATLMANARYDSSACSVIMNIPDPVLHNEIQNYIEENGGYIDVQLNSKILKIRVEYFILLAMSIEDDKTQKDIEKCLKKNFKKANKNNEVFEPGTKMKFLKAMCSSVPSAIELLNDICPYFALAAPLITGLISLLSSFASGVM